MVLSFEGVIVIKPVETIVFASGGTGGHVFPAISLAEEMSRRGYRVVMMTDQRGHIFQSYKEISEIISVYISRSEGLFGKVRRLATLGIAIIKSIFWLHRLKPKIVVGFGGYSSLPAMMAA